MKYLKLYENMHNFDENDPFGEEISNNTKPIQQGPGYCKNCGSTNLEWGGIEPFDNQVAYEYDCQDCNFAGYEIYNLVYVGHAER